MPPHHTLAHLRECQRRRRGMRGSYAVWCPSPRNRAIGLEGTLLCGPQVRVPCFLDSCSACVMLICACCVCVCVCVCIRADFDLGVVRVWLLGGIQLRHLWLPWDHNAYWTEHLACQHLSFPRAKIAHTHRHAHIHRDNSTGQAHTSAPK